jgi:FkbM family methyltransferase
MNPEILKAFRSVQVYFPGLQDLRFSLQRNLRGILKKTHEEDFEILPFLPMSSNNVFVDIGANRGDAIQSILMKRPGSTVIAFEPNPYLTSKLEKLYQDEPCIKIHNTGLGNEINNFPLYIPFYNNYMFDGLASFKEENARDWLRTRLHGFRPEKLEIKKVLCTVKRLDDFSLTPFFIKIDVQGFEYEVLLGAEKTIRKSRPIILMEAPKERELNFLSERSYQPFIYKNGKLLSGTKNYNVFFIPKEIVPSIRKKINID